MREGLIYEALSAAEARADPLLVATQKLDRLLARAPGYADELLDWTHAFLESAGLPESVDERRLREASCYLSEVNWRAHPDYRGVQSFNLVSSAILPGVDHQGRAFLSLVATLRYVGFDEDIAVQSRNLMSAKMIDRALVLGATMRVASVLTAGMRHVLARAPLSATRTKLTLTLPPAMADLGSDRLLGRVKGLAKLMGREAAIAIG